MKVILVNGSPHEKGATYTALCEVEKTLKEEGIETEIFQIGTEPIASCKECCACGRLHKCAINDNSKVNEFIEKAKTADGFVFGSPTHFDGPYGNLVSFMNRVFYSDCICGDRKFWLKPVAAFAVARRSGTTSAVAQMYKFFIEMTIVASRYNSCAFGTSASDVKRDSEGMQNMRIIGRNMAYNLKCREAAAKAGVELPKIEAPCSTNFI